MWVMLSSCGVKDGPPSDYGRNWKDIEDAVPKDEPYSRYGNPGSYEVFGERYHVIGSNKGFTQKGIASWYGSKFHGQRTSSGETYSMYAMTAAHKTLKIPAYVEVTNTANGRKAIVKVNDRGPFHEGRIIDLSYAAATKLGVAATGTAPVTIRVVTPGAVVANPSNVDVEQKAASAINPARLLEISLEHELLWNHSFARYFLGLAHYERNELHEAVAQLEIIVGKPYRFPIQNVVHCSFLLSLSYQALGLPDQAREVAESIARLTFERGNQMFIDLSEAFWADLDLLQGRIASAEKWARDFVLPPPHGLQRFFNAEFTSIRVLIALGTPQSLKSAAGQLDSMHKLTIEISHPRLLIDVLGMQALIDDTLGLESKALQKLSEALTLAESGGFIRPFLDLGRQMAALLKRFAKQNHDVEFTLRILGAFNEENAEVLLDATDEQIVDQQSISNQSLDDPLTEREMEILAILARKNSNAEIAEKLYISLETVKRHLYNIYQKLGVANRRQAIIKAKSLDLS